MDTIVNVSLACAIKDFLKKIQQLQRCVLGVVFARSQMTSILILIQKMVGRFGVKYVKQTAIKNSSKREIIIIAFGSIKNVKLMMFLI